MISRIPLLPLADQSLSISFEGVRFDIRVFSRGGRLFMDLAVDGVPAFYGLCCVLESPVNYSPAFPVPGEFWWVDTIGEADPFYEGLGSRFSLIWVAEGE